ncbi:TPA: hypothetical protein ACOEP6_003284 [Enterobacter ludwigii]
MSDPKNALIDEVSLDAENLSVLLELVLSNKELTKTQVETLLGMALNTSANIWQWLQAEEARREKLN